MDASTRLAGLTMETMVNDLITCKEAYLRTWWIKIPFEIRHAIKNKIVAGDWWLDVIKEIGPDGKPKVDSTTITALQKLGYMVYWANDDLSDTYRISWEQNMGV